MNTPTPDQIQKLPRWAQEYIKGIERERDMAIRHLNEYLDHQTPSAFYFDDHVCTGKHLGPAAKRIFIQTHKVTVCYKGVMLEVYTRQDEAGMDLNWCPCSPSGEDRSGDVAMIPKSYMKVQLVARDNMYPPRPDRKE